MLNTPLATIVCRMCTLLRAIYPSLGSMYLYLSLSPKGHFTGSRDRLSACIFPRLCALFVVLFRHIGRWHSRLDCFLVVIKYIISAICVHLFHFRFVLDGAHLLLPPPCVYDVPDLKSFLPRLVSICYSAEFDQSLTCEHVSFHNQIIKNGGKIFIH